MRSRWIQLALALGSVLFAPASLPAQVAVGPGRVDAPFVHVDWSGGWIHVCAPFVNLDVPAPRCWQANCAPQPYCDAAAIGQVPIQPMPSPPIAPIQQHRMLRSRSLSQITSHDIARSETTRAHPEELPAPSRTPYPPVAGASTVATSKNLPPTLDDRPRPQDPTTSAKQSSLSQ
jgi:hypothetical protein